MTVEEYFGYSREQIQSAIDFALEKGWNPPRKYRELTVPVRDIVIGDEIRIPQEDDYVTMADRLDLTSGYVEVTFNGGRVFALSPSDLVTLRLPL